MNIERKKFRNLESNFKLLFKFGSGLIASCITCRTDCWSFLLVSTVSVIDLLSANRKPKRNIKKKKKSIKTSGKMVKISACT